jgi:pyruvate/2-oxoglutarate dehydrogenase complex dihydrolipoamide dehydrogenase (E3) component
MKSNTSAGRYDSIVIGTGQAGPALAVRLAKAGRRTAIVERHLFGGTCVNVGCTPTKTLVASARAAHMAGRAADFGLRLGGAVAIDMARVKARKDAVVRESADGLERWLRKTRGLEVVEGHARFENPHAIRVGDRVMESDLFFIDVGARANIPPLEGVEDVPYLTSSTILDLERVPAHLIVVGGSYIGLEFAQMYRRFGAEVTIVEMGTRLISREDEDVSAAIREILEAEGIQVRVGAECIALARSAEGVRVRLHCDEEPRAVTGSHVLLAVGRRPNTDDLGLDKAEVLTDKRGQIVVDDALRTNVPHIFALGDVNGRGGFTHTAWDDYEIIAANLLDGASRRVTERIPVYALFIDPPLGRAGMGERDARASGRRVLAASMPMSKVSRARERGETDGLMKVLVDADTRELLGAAILGIGGDEVIHAVVDAMYAGATADVLRRAMHIHPTVAEYLPTLMGELEPLA